MTREAPKTKEQRMGPVTRNMEVIRGLRKQFRGAFDNLQVPEHIGTTIVLKELEHGSKNESFLVNKKCGIVGFSLLETSPTRIDILEIVGRCIKAGFNGVFDVEEISFDLSESGRKVYAWPISYLNDDAMAKFTNQIWAVDNELETLRQEAARAEEAIKSKLQPANILKTLSRSG